MKRLNHVYFTESNYLQLAALHLVRLSSTQQWYYGWILCHEHRQSEEVRLIRNYNNELVKNTLSAVEKLWIVRYETCQCVKDKHTSLWMLNQLIVFIYLTRNTLAQQSKIFNRRLRAERAPSYSLRVTERTSSYHHLNVDPQFIYFEEKKNKSHNVEVLLILELD